MKDYLHSLDDNEKKEIVDALLEMLGGVELSLFDLSIKPLKTIKHFMKLEFLTKHWVESRTGLVL